MRSFMNPQFGNTKMWWCWNRKMYKNECSNGKWLLLNERDSTIDYGSNFNYFNSFSNCHINANQGESIMKWWKKPQVCLIFKCGMCHRINNCNIKCRFCIWGGGTFFFELKKHTSKNIKCHLLVVG